MLPVTTVEEMRAIDEAAHREGRLDELVARAGWEVARRAVAMMGGTYGRRVVVVAGKGNNGADGRVAAALLADRGARVRVVDAAEPPESISGYDLVVDAAYGTGFRGDYRAPRTEGEVLAVDIPSGVDGDTGAACDGAVVARSTVTFAAYKPGLLFGAGAGLSGEVVLADIGLDVSRASTWVLEGSDVVVPWRGRAAHKWSMSVSVVAGSPGMMGAARLCSMAAMRAGAGMVRLGVPGATSSDLPLSEVVARSLPEAGWETDVVAELGRCRVLAIGSGLGRNAGTSDSVRHLVAASPVPAVVDADGIVAFGSPAELASAVASAPGREVVITPHDGEFTRLTGAPPGEDRLGACRKLAGESGAVVLLKGPTTVVAHPDGRAFLVVAGTPVLATAGSGDVLTGMIAAFIARGLDPFRAAGFAAQVHGEAGRCGRSEGLVAGDLLDLVPECLEKRLEQRTQDSAPSRNPGVPASPRGGADA